MYPWCLSWGLQFCFCFFVFLVCSMLLGFSSSCASNAKNLEKTQNTKKQQKDQNFRPHVPMAPELGSEICFFVFLALSMFLGFSFSCASNARNLEKERGQKKQKKSQISDPMYPWCLGWGLSFCCFCLFCIMAFSMFLGFHSLALQMSETWRKPKTI